MDKELTQEEMIKQAVEDAVDQAEDVQTNCESMEEEAFRQVEEDSSSQDEFPDESDDLEQGKPDESELTWKEKKAKRKNKKDKKDEQIEELTDKLTRQMAEFENFRKRTEKEKSQMYEIGAKDIIEKILPTVDNFERGLKSVSEDEKENAFVDGMDKVYQQLIATLKEVCVEPIEALGQEFNPDLHNAVMHVEEEEAGENVIVEEFQRGYTYRGNVVRYSMVKVAN